ncbi:hypothetical protein QMO56_19605 [Roseomonas sp. E05]|uniref:hypothetical protein n=1 Tax=Roseomonas sp. E05 TaxID=3046310 RepID=UPI0024B9FCB9|nr:hypothetical protein [Roseomonas sp. E05]MDJ0390322.1 hypothetical protein [Roseomonas sp. E05]
MQPRFQPAIFALSLFAALGASVVAAQANGPIEVVGQGENFAVVYPPGHDENIVGGGRAEVAGNGENLGIRYLDHAAAHPVSGVPVPTGGESDGVAYLQPNHHYGERTAEVMRNPHVRHHL